MAALSFAFISCLLFCSCFGALKVLQVTDAHLDAFYAVQSDADCGCHFFNGTANDTLAGSAGERICDSYAPLIYGILRWASLIQPDVVIWTGDAARHSYFAPRRSWSEVVDTNALMASLLKKYFPASLGIVVSIGNNDARAEKFSPPPSDLADLAQAWSAVFTDHLHEKSLFAQGGFYDAVFADNQLTVFSINTLALANDEKDCATGTLGDVQLNWLSQRLPRALGAVILAGHLPPVFFTPRCRARYASITSNSGAFHMYAHEHKDATHFMLPNGTQLHAEDLCPSSDVSRMIVAACAPSLTPNYNPALRLYHLDDNYRVASYLQYYTSLEKLNALPSLPSVVPFELEYEFPRDFGLSGSASDPATWCAWKAALHSNATLAKFQNEIEYVMSGVTTFPKRQCV